MVTSWMKQLLLLAMCVMYCKNQESDRCKDCNDTTSIIGDWSNCEISRISNSLIRNCEGIIILKLNNNKLEKITQNMFSHLTVVKKLSLNSNKIWTIENGSFKNNKNLRELYLNDNRISELTKDVFVSLTWLKTLQLSSNTLTKISGETFSHLTALIELRLDNNTIATIQQESFAHNTKLLHLSLQKNQISKLPQDLFKPLNRLKILQLHRNRLTKLTKDMFSHLTDLFTLDLNNNKIEEIEDESFANNTNLSNLHLQENQISKLPEKIFAGLSKLKYLNLSGNQLIRVAEKLFSNSIQLRHFDLSFNKIKLIEAGAFSSLESLEHIHLQHNELTLNEIERYNFFHNSTNLLQLDLSHNAISCPINRNFIMNIAFAYHNFTDEDVPQSSCVKNSRDGKTTEIVTIKSLLINKAAFLQESRNNSSTVTVVVQQNPIRCDCYHKLITQFEVDARIEVTATPSDVTFSCGLNYVKNMKTVCPSICYCSCDIENLSLVVNCSNKNITYFPDLSMLSEVVFNSVELHFEGNRLLHGPQVGIGYENVTELYLSNGSIQHVSWLPPKLRILKLDQNKIKTLEPDILIWLLNTNLANLSLQKNPWTCDCTALPLLQVIKKITNRMKIEPIICRDGRELIMLDKKTLCQDGAITIPNVVGACLLMLLLVLIIVIVYCKNRTKIKTWLCMHRTVVEEDLDNDRQCTMTSIPLKTVTNP